MTIKTHTLQVEVSSIAELKEKTACTPVSDELAKQFGHNPNNCEMWNGNLFVYNEAPNIVLVYDFFTKERQMYDFNLERA